jgi:hypothetical protein
MANYLQAYYTWRDGGDLTAGGLTAELTTLFFLLEKGIP